MTIEFTREQLENAGKLRRERETADIGDWHAIELCPVCGSKRKCKLGPKGIEVFCYINWGRHIVNERYTDAPIEPRAERKASKKETGPTEPVIPDDVLDKAHRTFLDELALLSPEHLENLTKRGFTKGEAIMRYRSLPKHNLENNTRRIEARDKASVAAGVESSAIPFLAACVRQDPSILVPVISIENKIVGIQFRLDKGEKRYLWPQGSVSRCHVAYPEDERDQRVWITEGPIKGELTAKFTGATTIALPGVNSAVPEAIKILGKLADIGRATGRPVPSVIIAYDSDIVSKPGVQLGFNRVLDGAVGLGLRVEMATWDQRDGKGIDDLLAAGKQPTIVEAKPVEIDPKIKKARVDARVESKDITARAKKVFETVADFVATTLGDTKGAERFYRAARCGRLDDVSSCARCDKPIGSKSLAAESPLCPHCYAIMLHMTPLALEKMWPAQVIIGSIALEDETMDSAKKKQAAVTKVLKKIDKNITASIRWVRAPRRLTVVGCELSDATKINAVSATTGLTVELVTNVVAAREVVKTLRLRASYMCRLIEEASPKKIADDPWARRFVSTTGGKNTRKQLKWPNTKALRD